MMRLHQVQAAATVHAVGQGHLQASGLKVSLQQALPPQGDAVPHHRRLHQQLIAVGAQRMARRVVVGTGVGEPVGPGQPIVVVVLDDQQGVSVQQVVQVANWAVRSSGWGFRCTGCGYPVRMVALELRQQAGKQDRTDGGRAGQGQLAIGTTPAQLGGLAIKLTQQALDGTEVTYPGRGQAQALGQPIKTADGPSLLRGV
ncbi:hypothetical protein Ddc_21564 [Ditylenchus destructor]|nr:hypothetical protein Ddc_21564 [Ditylenchus destructor]